MNTFRLLSITNNPEEYPESMEDTLEFPELVEWVDDEQIFLIYWVEKDTVYPASEFFYMIGGLKNFSTLDEIK